MSSTVDISDRKNLAQISKMLTQITSGAEFGDDSPAFVPVNDFVRKASKQISSWLLQGMSSIALFVQEIIEPYVWYGGIVADVPDAETQYHAHEFLDATVQPKAIFITPNEVYAMHALLSQHLDSLVWYESNMLYHKLTFV